MLASFLKGMVQDSNASCIDVALDALLAFAENYINASEYAADLAPLVVAKGLSGRPGTITRAEEALLKLMEVMAPSYLYMATFNVLLYVIYSILETFSSVSDTNSA